MATFSDNFRQLRSRQPSARGISWYARWVVRPCGSALASAIALTPLTPNAVSTMNGVVSLVGLVILATNGPTVGTGLIVSLLLSLGYMLDSADGQLARLRGTGSRSGEWFDHVIDAGKMVLVHSAVLISWYLFFDLPDPSYLLIPIGFQFVQVVTFVAGTLAQLLLRGDRRRAERTPSVLTSVLLLPADFGVLALTFLLLGFNSVFVAVYSLMLAANAVLLAALCVRSFRALRAA